MRTSTIGWALCSLVLAMVVTGVVAAADPNLVGYWKFDGNTLDSSGNGRHASLGGSPQFVPGVFGDALEFDGDDSVTITGYKGIQATNPFSIAAWIKTESTDTITIVTWGSAANGAKIEFRIITNVLRANHGLGNVNSASIVNDGQWHHVALTVTANATVSYPQMILYVDGRDDTVPSTDADPVLDIIPSFDVGIGWRSTNSDRYWEGLIDEVRIYDRVLTAAEIKAMVPPKVKARNPDPADGSTAVVIPLLRWTAGETAVLHSVYFGTDPNLGPKDLVQSRLPVTLYFHVPGLTPGTTYYWRVDEIEADMTTVHTGNVWTFIAQPFTAYLPAPANGANDASGDPNAILTWLAGMNATGHHVYFGDSREAVLAGKPEVDKGTVTGTTFAPGPLEPLATYYWRVDEIGPANAVTQGPVWSFTTFLPVDDFESYTDDVNAKATIYDTWIDGLTNGLTGSTVGNPQAPFAERKIVHGGKQSMPLDYNNVNSPWYSEAERQWTAAQNWTADGADTLHLFLRGNATNGLAALYVAVEDSSGKIAVAANANPNAVRVGVWTQWKVPLSNFAGVNLARVKKLYLGVGDRKNPTPDGFGRIYLDDIRLTRP